MSDQSTPTPAWPDPLQAPDPASVAHALASFWQTLSELPELLAREEYLLAAELVQRLRIIVIDLMLALNGIRRPATTAHLNHYLSANQRQALERTLVARSPAGESWTAQAVALVVIYRWYAPQLTAHFNLTYPQALEARVWSLLQSQIHAWPAAITSDAAASAP